MNIIAIQRGLKVGAMSFHKELNIFEQNNKLIIYVFQDCCNDEETKMS